MDPVTQILAQAAAGSAEGQGFGEFFVKGRQLGLEQQKIDLDKQAHVAQAVRDALNARVAEQNLQLNALKIGEAVRERDQVIKNETDVAALGRFIQEKLGGMGGVPGIPGLPVEDLRSTLHGAFDFFNRNPRLWSDPRAMQALEAVTGVAKSLEGEAALDRRLEQQLEIARLQYGKPMTATTTSRDIESLAQWERTLKEAQATGNTALAADAKTHVDAYRARLFPSGTTVTTQIDPTTKQPITTVRLGGAAPLDTTKPSAATVTRLQESLARSNATASTAVALRGLIRPDSVGLPGIIAEAVLDKALPMLFGARTADIQRMDTRTRLRAFANQMVQELNEDPRLSDADRKILREIPPDPDEWLASSDKARSDLTTLARMSAKKAVRDAHSLGVPAPQSLLPLLDPAGVRELFRGGYLSQDESIRLLLPQ